MFVAVSACLPAGDSLASRASATRDCWPKMNTESTSSYPCETNREVKYLTIQFDFVFPLWYQGAKFKIIAPFYLICFAILFSFRILILTISIAVLRSLNASPMLVGTSHLSYIRSIFTVVVLLQVTGHAIR
jgi:hypothetical protein